MAIDLMIVNCCLRFFSQGMPLLKRSLELLTVGDPLHATI